MVIPMRIGLIEAEFRSSEKSEGDWRKKSIPASIAFMQVGANRHGEPDSIKMNAGRRSVLSCACEISNSL